MRQDYKPVSGTFLRECIRKIKYLRRNHLEATHHMQTEHLQEIANGYFERFRHRKLIVSIQDMPTFADYINTFALEDKEKLLMQLEDSGFAAREYLQQPHSTWWQKLWNEKEKKQAFIATKVINKVSSWFDKWQKRIISGTMVAIVAVGSALLLKNDANAKDINLNKTSAKTEKSINTQQRNLPHTKDYEINPLVKNESKSKTKTEKEQNIWDNFYQHRLNRFISKSKAETLVANFNSQQQKGIFNLPQDISIRQYLYAAQIYRLYGYKSIAKEMMQLHNAKKQINDNVQNKLFNYVRQAGKKGVGVQQMRMAQQQYSNTRVTR